MPALGMAQETGTVVRWLKAEGQEVTKGEPLLEIETDKATVEVEAPASGLLAGITAAAGDEVPVGQVIAFILAPGETVPVFESAPTPPAPAAAPEVLASPVAASIAAEHNIDLRQVKPEGGRVQKADVLAYLAARRVAAQQAVEPAAIAAGGRLPASPKARRLAAERNLELAAIRGSGPNGAVLAADVLAAAQAPAPSPPPAAMAAAQTLPVSRIWAVMVERLTHSWASAPHFYLTREANAGRLLAWREAVQQGATEKITYTDLLVKLVASALVRHSRLNARWEEDAIVLNPEINIGLAVAVEEGLVVPVVHRADRLGLSELAARRRELVARAQAGKLSLDDIRDGTFTLSNLGMYGVDAFSAVINPPQAAILAVGRIAERVVPLNGQPSVQPMTTLTLSCDHRVVDGARGAQFLQTLVDFIEEPLRVLD